MRDIILDTETTGLDPTRGDRIVEIGCLEMLHKRPTGRTFHVYINPERDMPAEAFAVHGLSAEFLAGHPVFASVADDFLAFIQDATLVIHNASFDLKFLNAELVAHGYASLQDRPVVDTLQLARRKFPGAKASLDALCKRFDIDLKDRSFHGAMLDANLLSHVYVELMGGRQPGLFGGDIKKDVEQQNVQASFQRKERPLRIFPPTKEEQEAHFESLVVLTKPLWKTC